LIVNALEVNDKTDLAILLGYTKGWEAPISSLDFFWGESSQSSYLALSFDFLFDCLSETMEWDRVGSRLELHLASI
jgi:hypothetical protein